MRSSIIHHRSSIIRRLANRAGIASTAVVPALLAFLVVAPAADRPGVAPASRPAGQGAGEAREAEAHGMIDHQSSIINRRSSGPSMVHRQSSAQTGGLRASAGAAFVPAMRDARSVFNPASPSAQAIRNLFFLVLAISAVIFVLVVGAMLYFVVRFRRRAGEDDSEPPQIYGSQRLELAWTIAPTLIVFVLFLVVIRTVVAMRSFSPPPGDLLVRVIAHQWWWGFDYPEYHFATANEMHVPVGDAQHPRTIYLELISADVAHSFWVPRLAGKTDVIPGRVNQMFFQALRPGDYHGQCSEYCGAEHSRMLILVVAQPPEQFEAWVKHQQQPAVEDPAAEPGRRWFLANTCRNCHTIRGTPAAGTVGPDLTHLMSRQTIATFVPNNREDLVAWVTNPQAVKPDCKMPDLNLTPDEVQTIVDYLVTLR